jgi:hypothetical protein
MAKKTLAKTRDSAAIAQKTRLAKVRKTLKEWADGSVRLELLIPGAGLSVRGIIKHLGDDPEDDGFLFVSASREVTSTIFLMMWKASFVKREGPLGTRVYLCSGVSGKEGLTLAEEGNRESETNKMATLLEQLRLWAKLRTGLISSFEFPFVGTYWTSGIEEYKPGIFALVNKDSNQFHLIDTARCGQVEIKRTDAETIVSLSSRTGHFQITISDMHQTLKEASERFALQSKMVH